MTTLIISIGNIIAPPDILLEIKKNKGTVFIDTIRDINIFDIADSILVVDDNPDWYRDNWILHSLDIAIKKKMKISFLSDK